MRGKSRVRRTLFAAAIGAAATIAVAVPAWATTQFVGGGTWIYGVSYGINESQYYHPNNWHTSSVKSDGLVDRSDCTEPGVYSDAWLWAAAYGNQAYWNNSC